MNYTHWIYKEGFTTKLTSYYYILPLSPRSATLGALLARVLERGSKKYPTVEAINDKMDELYGAAAFFDVNIYGSYLCFEAKLIMPNYSFLNQPELEEQARRFLHSLLYEPLVEKESFKESFFLQEKEMLSQDIENLYKDPDSYALLRSLELIFPESNLGIYKYGDSKVLKELTRKELWEFYQEVMQAPLYIYHHSDENKDDQVNKGSFPMEKVNITPADRTYKEDRDIDQSILIQAYYVPWSYQDKMVYPLLVVNHLLGGSGTSLLFKNVREEKGLCYSIYSRYDRFRQLLLIMSGHEKEQAQELLATIEEVLQALKEGRFSDKELADSKQDLCIGIASIPDSQGRHLKDSFVRDLFGDEKEIEGRIEQVEKVEKSDVIKAANSLSRLLNFYVRQK